MEIDTLMTVANRCIPCDICSEVPENQILVGQPDVFVKGKVLYMRDIKEPAFFCLPCQEQHLKEFII